MSVRDIRAHWEGLPGLEVSPDLISRVADAVMDEVREWRSRALDAVHPVVILDALRARVRDKDSRMVRISPRCRPRSEARGGRRLHRAGDHRRGELRGPRSLDRGRRGREARARRHERASRPGRPGRPHRGRGRAGGLSRGDRGGLPRGHGPDPGSGSGAGSASSISCATRRTFVRGRTATPSPPGSAPSAAPRPPRRPATRGRPSTRLGQRGIPRSPRPGGEPARRSSRSPPSAPRSGA